MIDRRLALALPLVLLAACKGDGSGDDGDVPFDVAACPYISGGDTTAQFTSTCASCTVTNQAAAYDGDAGTFATVNMPALSQGSVALRVTAQDGVVFSAGSNPGVILSSAGNSGNTVFNNGYELRTYMDGAPAGSTASASPTIVGGSGSSTPYRASFTSAAAFNAVEVGYTFGTNSEDKTFRVHEFCSDG